MGTPTGQQFELTRSSDDRQSRAIITERAAGLRRLVVDGVDLVETFSEGTIAPYGSGLILVPWPNRVEDGLWQLDGEGQQLDLTEPSRHNAIHGLLRNSSYRVGDRSESAITLTAAVFPQHGYPFGLDTSVTYTLVEHGLRVTHSIVNTGEGSAPVAVGAHPYLRIGDLPVDDLTLTVAASTHFEVDDRLIPRAETPVDGTAFDLRSGRLLGDLTLDDGFGGVAPHAVHRLTAADGQYVELFRDPEFAFAQVFTNRLFARNGTPALAVAVEPMTAPANALNSGQGLKWLAEGESWTLSWGIRYSPAIP